MRLSVILRTVFRYVGSSWERAGILMVLGAWTLALGIVYQHQVELLRAVGIA